MKTDKKFILRPLMPEDAESMANQLNNKKIWDNLRDGLPYPYSIEDAKAFIELQNNEPLLTCYGIVVDGKVVGNIGFTRNRDVERFSAEVGYFIGEDYWGKGIMPAALASAINDYFCTTDVIRLYATPFGYNKSSARVLEKVGFSLKCMMIKAAYKNGQFTDELYFERLKQGNESMINKEEIIIGIGGKEIAADLVEENKDTTQQRLSEKKQWRL